MTSEIDSKQTNELLQRRRLRLQQVREQSKEIAKKIRQRAKVETLQQEKDLDEKKVKQYLDCQKQFVDRLQKLYTNGLKNVGAGHKNASDQVHQENDTKGDKSKLRGLEAVAEVRRKKQEILDKKKELLDRKLQARDAANERSREKSNNIAKSLQVQVSGTVINKEFEDNNHSSDIPKKVDIATQLDIDEPLNDVERDIPLLILPESESAMDGSNDKPERLDKIKKLNLFALSAEMPSSLRGGTENIPQEITQMKPSLTLVSEYIQNRKLRLRESDTSCKKKQTENLENIKQTILRTRASKTEGNDPGIACDVLDDHCTPVPNWRAESSRPSKPPAKINSAIPPLNSRKFKSIFNLSNKTNRILRSKPITIEEGETFPCRNYHLKNLIQSVQESNKENSSKSNDAECVRKRPVVVYNHLTRDTKTVTCNDENLVIRDHNTDDNAFSKAQKQETNDNLKETKLQEKIAEERRKVAVARENVDKEYRDTLAFLNSLPKDMTSKPNRVAYMDEKRQQQIKDNFERKLVQEYKNIEKEYKNHRCKHSKPHLSCRTRSSEQKHEDLADKKVQYSWMPVPEKERNLAIHNIPTTRKDVRHGNTVQFSDDNDYHEYRSSHKHTPPTKDKSNKSKPFKNRYVETVLIEQNGHDSTDCTSITSDSSSLENIDLKSREKNYESTEKYDLKESESDRIIIYKILNSKNDKRKKFHRKTKSSEKVGKTLGPSPETANHCNSGTNQTNPLTSTDKIDNTAPKLSFGELKEGIYRTVKENGQIYNEVSLSTTNIEEWYFSSDRRPWWDNMASLQFSEKPARHEEEAFNRNTKSVPECDNCITNTKAGDANCGPSLERLTPNCNCAANTQNPNTQSVHYPSAATSASSLKTNLNNVNIVPPDSACIKLIDEASQENGKFYVGTTGFLKNDAYEVVIQLRKKEIHGVNEDSKKRDELAINAKDAELNLPLQKSDVSVQADTISNKISDSTDAKPDDTCPRVPTTTPANSNDALDSSKNDFQQPITTSCVDQNKVNVPEDASPRINVVPKQATSTYTQTSNSPVHRPVFMHMSSSTSTAYMSPPDIIIPRFLKRNHPVSYEETCDSTTLNEPQSLRQCTCKHHDNNRRTARQTKSSNKFRKLNSTQNSASSAAEIRDLINNKYRMSPASQSSKKNHTCSKSRKHSKHTKTSSDDLNILFSKNLQNIKCDNAMRNTKTALNPIIKAYVNKLLDLNKEGIKAVEIINQDCSSVPTPASSIINNTLNVDTKITDEKKISLEQIKNMLKRNIMDNQKANDDICKKVTKHHQVQATKKNIKTRSKSSKRKQLHKVKSLNISRKWSKTSSVSNCEKYDNGDRQRKQQTSSTSSSLKNGNSVQQDRAICNKQKCSRNSSASPRETAYEPKTTKVKSDPRLRLVTTPVSTDSENIPIPPTKHKKRESTPPAHISTQTSGTFDSDTNFMKIAEGKLQNMEKIADLTEKCTKRLSNLAKVLEEVRRNKSLVYSQITSSESQTSDSDLERNKNSTKNRSPLVDCPELQSPFLKVTSSIITSEDEKEKCTTDSETFVPLLTDIPKPSDFKTPLPVAPKRAVSPNKENVYHHGENFKIRGKPPPALSRIHLKNEQEKVIPHELSTVLEVDSPMSLKLKSKSRIDVNADTSKKSTDSVGSITPKEDRTGTHTTLHPASDKEHLSTDMKNYPKTSKRNNKTATDSSDDSKLRMMDLKEFNEIMLKPFISIHEYAKKKNIDAIDEASTIDYNVKDVLLDEDLSSLHSDNSLPDVIAELLKRKIINEPFKFDTASNVNTSTISTESTVSLLTLSNTRKERNKSLFQNKKFVPEMSDSLSISSNPDLEQAFQKLGMGWASSTLKKTKERLALSSSSNTSSSSLLLRNNLTTIDKSPRKKHKDTEVPKHVEQQTSLPNSMTVKEFLTNELAKKITFTNKSTRDDTEQEFVSLFETKIPEQLKQSTREEIQDLSDNGLANGTNNNRARTSTPVQIFRSMTYHSTSSTNTSNGLFSNADDLSSVKVTSNSIRNHSTSDKDDLTIPNYILRTSKTHSDCSKSDN